MKKIITLTLTLVITFTSVFCSLGVAAAETKVEKVSLNQLASFYCQCLKAENPRTTESQARYYLLNCLRSGIISRLLKLPISNLEARSKKIVEFYNLANTDGFTNYYHPNQDLTINEAEILNDLPTDNSLCIMLFGNHMTDEGTMSDKFHARCKTALAMATKYPNAWIMITGGHTGGYDCPSEAETGKTWLIEHGIDANRIITDELSWDTYSNIFCSFATSELCSHTEISNFVVVSSDYHVPTCSIYLMTYIYTFGYDLPYEDGGRNYKYLGNLGAVLD